MTRQEGLVSFVAIEIILLGGMHIGLLQKHMQDRHKGWDWDYRSASPCKSGGVLQPGESCYDPPAWGVCIGNDTMKPIATCYIILDSESPIKTRIYGNVINNCEMKP